eukprot:438194_1
MNGTAVSVQSWSCDPTNSPSSPSTAPTRIPSIAPTMSPSTHSTAPTRIPSIAPTRIPSTAPTRIPSIAPTMSPSISDIDVTVKETNDTGSIMVGIVITTVMLIAVIIYCKRLQTNKTKIQKDIEEDSKDNKMTEQGMEAAEAKHDEAPSNNPQRVAVVDDIAKNEKEPGQENSNSFGNFEEIFVAVQGEESISKSDGHKV